MHRLAVCRMCDRQRLCMKLQPGRCGSCFIVCIKTVPRIGCPQCQHMHPQLMRTPVTGNSLTAWHFFLIFQHFITCLSRFAGFKTLSVSAGSASHKSAVNSPCRFPGSRCPQIHGNIGFFGSPFAELPFKLPLGGFGQRNHNNTAGLPYPDDEQILRQDNHAECVSSHCLYVRAHAVRKTVRLVYSPQ